MPRSPVDTLECQLSGRVLGGLPGIHDYQVDALAQSYHASPSQRVVYVNVELSPEEVRARYERELGLLSNDRIYTNYNPEASFREHDNRNYINLANDVLGSFDKSFEMIGNYIG
jgi:hypothetical protein